MQCLYNLINTHEDWLMNRVLHHARLHDYTKYTSTLAEAWRASIQGLSEPLMRVIKESNEPPELSPDDNFITDPIASFGITEAQRHRSRGVTLSMFIGLMKYYKQSYIDLVTEAGFSKIYEENCRLFIERFFDRVEIGFTVEWSALSEDEKIKELQTSNRKMTNEKNKYLTIFESTPNPVIFLSKDNVIDNMNHAAAALFYGIETPGSTYYAVGVTQVALPWKIDEVTAFISGNQMEYAFERALETNKGARHFQVKLKRMLDVSQKFSGISLILNDITESKQLEDRLSTMSITDELTGLYNRRGFITLSQQQMAVSRRTKKGMILFFVDLDGLKWINDNLGHEEGDKALIEAASVLKDTFRASDIIARLGGDEFATLAIDMTEKDSEIFTVRLQSLIGTRNKQKNRGYRLSISVGASYYDPEKPRSLEELLLNADQLMYNQKQKKKGMLPQELSLSNNNPLPSI